VTKKTQGQKKGRKLNKHAIYIVSKSTHESWHIIAPDPIWRFDE